MPLTTPSMFTDSTQSHMAGDELMVVPPPTPALLNTMCTDP